MSQTQTPLEHTTEAVEKMDKKERSALVVQDRSLPLWASVLSAGFTFGSALCVLSLTVFAVFLHKLVAIEGIESLALLLGATALVPILGMVLFETGHARALAGLRPLRKRSGAIGPALLGVLALGGLATLHPLLALPALAGCMLGWLISVPLSRWLPRDPGWDILPAEATSLLIGRDQHGIDLLNAPAKPHAFIMALLKSMRLAAFISSFALACWLTLHEVLSAAAIAPTALISYGIVLALTDVFLLRSEIAPEVTKQASSVTAIAAAEGDTGLDGGLKVEHLSVSDRNGHKLLQDLSFQMTAGSVTGITGDSFAGKSLLLKALTAPHDLTNLAISGHVSIHGQSPWHRSGRERDVDLIYLGAQPLILPGSGGDNLYCFRSPDSLRGEHLLKSLVHNSDVAQHIIASADATTLSHAEQKALAFARAFYLRPAAYLIDRPEDGSGELLRGTLLTRLREERRRGAIILLVTEDRALLEECDQLIVLQNGRLVEMASAAEIRDRKSSGWQRFVAKRDLDSEEALDSWICAQFRRDGDDANRRAVCMVANEMLALACNAAGPGMGPGAATGTSPPEDTVCFEIKLFAGHCVMRLQQAQPLSSGALAKAQSDADSDRALTQAPLARILRDSMSVENTVHNGSNWLQVAISIYDPRKSSPQSPPTSETTADALSRS